MKTKFAGKSLKVFLSAAIAVAGLLSASIIAPRTIAAAATELYASPTGDSTECSEASPCSLTDVQTKVRSINGNMSGDIIVNLRGGTYNIGSTIALDGRDSGTNGYTVHYQSFAGETPVFEGGQAVTGWTIHDEQNNIYSANVGDRQFRQLYVEDQRAIRARTPNQEDEVTGGPYNTAVSVNGSNFVVNASQIANWANLNQVEVVWRGHWMQKIGHIQSYAVNGDQATITFPANEAAGFVDRKYTDMATTYFHFENAYEFLDAEGEWYLDTSSSEHTLYYKPRNGEDMSSVNVMTPGTETLVSITGTSSEPVHHVTFEGITFQHSNWTKPSSVGLVDGQSMVQLQTDGNAIIPGAVNVSNATNLLFEGNIFRQTGAHGLHFRDLSSHNTVIDNTFSDLSAGGLYSFSSDSSYDNFIYNTVENFGRYYTGAVGIYASRPDHMVIDHNTVSYGRYTGISIGWSWDNTETGTNYNHISHNLIHNVMELHDDGGGIYSLGKQRNSTRYKNYIYGITRSPYMDDYPVAGIYLDNGSSDITVESNVLENTNHAFYARNTPNYNNLFRNNFYNITRGFINGTDGEPGHSFVPVSFLYNEGETEFVTGEVLGTPRNDVSAWVGMKVTTGSSPVTVKQLGRWVIAGNTGVHTVKIVDTKGQDLASVDVPTDGAPVGFKYMPLAEDFVLAANTSYYIVSSETSGGDFWYNENSTITTTNAAMVDKQFYSFGIDNYLGNTLINNTQVSDVWPAEAEAIKSSAGADAQIPALLPESVEPVNAYEAELGEWDGDSTGVEAVAAASGGQVVDSIDNAGEYTQIDQVNGGRGGIISLVIRYANGTAAYKPLSLYVNNIKVQQVGFAPTGDWNSFQDTVSIPLILDAGTINTIRLQNDSSDSPSAAIDKFTVTTIEDESTPTDPTDPPAPTQDPDSDPGVIYEAEDAALTGGAAVNTDHDDFTGTGFLGGFGIDGAGVTFTVNTLAAVTKEVTLRYANGDTDIRSLSIYVNGTKVKQTSLTGTGSWNEWGYKTEQLSLNAGVNTITYKKDADDAGRVNIDNISISFDADHEHAAGKKYEAELALLAGGPQLNNNHAGFSGDGFVDNIADGTPSLTFAVQAASAGGKDVTIRYADGDEERTLSIYVNGTKLKQVFFSGTGSWDTWGNRTVKLTLAVGANTISIQKDNGDTGRINIDYISIAGEAEAGSAVKLTGADAVVQGTDFDLTYGVENVEGLAAQDITISYDKDLFTFVGAASVKEGTEIQQTVHNEEAGTIRLAVVSLGHDGAIEGAADVLRLTFSPKVSGTGAIAVTSAGLSNGNGDVNQAAPVSHSITVSSNKTGLIALIGTAQDEYDSAVEGVEIGQYPEGTKAALLAAVNAAAVVRDNSAATTQQVTQAITDLTSALSHFQALIIMATTGDLNSTPGYDVGDLGIISYNYGATSADANWNSIKRADINGDGMIGIYELAFIAMKMFN